MDKQYALQYIPLFFEDLEKIIDYISEELNNPQAANQLLDEIESAIRKRLNYPLSFSPCFVTKKYHEVYYRINVKNYVIFYVVKGNIMEVRRIVYDKRDWLNVIKR